MQNSKIVGVDLGGTNVRAGVVLNNTLQQVNARPITSNGSIETVLEEIYSITDQLVTSDVQAIGIGVPGLIDEVQHLVYDVVNIPSWKEVPLEQLMKDRYHIPVFVNNDANCFALGEFHFGKGKGHSSMIGLTIGTGLGTGIIINNKLYSGNNCGAGEFGMAAYLDQCYEYYASGQFFENVYHTPGEVVYQKAQQGDPAALKMFVEMGEHLGNAIKVILYALDPSTIILGGSVSKAWPLFNASMWQSIRGFAFQRSLQRLTIDVSDLEHSGILGAAALCLDAGSITFSSSATW